MGFKDQLRSLFFKESQARIVTSINQVGKPVSTPINYESLSSHGYCKNAVVYSAISKITTAASGINWVLYSKKGRNKTEIIEHPLLTLINRPNPLQAKAAFIESLIGFKMISGNTYIELNQTQPNQAPREMWSIRPDKMTIVPSRFGYVGEYVYKDRGNERRWLVDQVTLRSSIIHMKTFNPLDQWYGMSPLQAAIFSLDANNAGKKWNQSLLQNQATPSGVLQMKVSDANPRGELTDEQYRRLKNEFEESYTGSRNAGRPMIIEGGLNWQSISLSPKDMAYLEGSKMTATELALVYGVPPELIGVGEKTYNNYQEARAALYEDCVLPILDGVKDELNMRLTPLFGDNLFLDYDKDDIEALAFKREAKYTSIGSSNFLTQNEKREAVGYDQIPGWDVFVIGSQVVENPEDYNNGGFGSFGDSNLYDSSDDSSDDSNNDSNEDLEDEKSSSRKQDASESHREQSAKSINLLTANEKRKSWIFQNRKRASLAAKFESEVSRDFTALTKELIKAANRLKEMNTTDKKLTEFAMLTVLDNWTPSLEETLKANTEKSLREFAGLIIKDAKDLGLYTEKKDIKFEGFVKEYIQRRTGTQITSITNTTKKRIRETISEWVYDTIQEGETLQDLAKYIQADFESLNKKQAMRIARTEVSMASTNGSLGAAKTLEVPGLQKEWVTASDDRVREGDKGYADHSAMHGVIVDINEKFDVPPDASMDGPGDSSASADQVINCRCVLVYKTANT